MPQAMMCQICSDSIQYVEFINILPHTQMYLLPTNMWLLINLVFTIHIGKGKYSVHILVCTALSIMFLTGENICFDWALIKTKALLAIIQIWCLDKVFSVASGAVYLRPCVSYVAYILPDIRCLGCVHLQLHVTIPGEFSTASEKVFPGRYSYTTWPGIIKCMQKSLWTRLIYSIKPKFGVPPNQFALDWILKMPQTIIFWLKKCDGELSKVRGTGSNYLR